jgi:hypothetical protein
VVRDPGEQIVSAILMLNDACARIGVSPPAIIGVRSAVAVNAIEAAIVAAGKRDEVHQIVGGIEIRGVAIKPRPS